MIPSHDMFVGLLCTWNHKPRGGYGYTVPVAAKVVCLSLDGTRATIEVSTKAGAKVRRTVSHEALSRSGGQ